MDTVLLGSIIGGLIGIAIGLVKILENIISKKKNGNDNKKSGCEECIFISQLPLIYDFSKNSNEILKKTDNDGIHLCYTPRSFIETQKDIIGILNKILNVQRETMHLIEYRERSDCGERKRK